VTVLFRLSFAVTVMEIAVPALAFGGVERTRWTLAAGVTVTPLCVPVSALVTVSAAVMLRVPGVLSVAMKEWTP
jgi:hypothetical protein